MTMTVLSDETIDRAADQLAEYRSNDALPEVLDQYAVLIESYKHLKNEYEEARDAREHYKQQARDQGRNPFVLVLIDGDGYIFDEKFIKGGSEGGSRAAKQLNDAVKSSLRRKELEGCEVMVRVFANLATLSRYLHKNSLCGAENRSLSSFAAGFNRSYGMADFVDAGELKENADFKIRAMLRFYADNTQCKHVFFAACHDVGYVSDLISCGNNKKFSLIRTPSLPFHAAFNKLDMNIEELPGVFLQTPLPQARDLSKANPSAASGTNKFVQAFPATTSREFANNNNTACPFYASGNCKYGRSCKFSHIDSKMSPQDNQNGSSSPNIMANSSISNGSKNNSDWRGGSVTSFGSNIDDLPRKEHIPEGYIAVNVNQDRLDAYLQQPSADAVNRFKALSKPKKFCNNKQLFNSCNNESCKYNHEPIPDDIRLALECVSRTVPCSRGGACRKFHCVYGHVCQRTDCKNRGHANGYCRFPLAICNGDYKLLKLVLETARADSPLSPPVGSEDARNTQNNGVNLWV